MIKPKHRAVPDFIVKQRAEAQAKLDALLATVEVKPRTKYERLPKKVGEIVVDTGLKDGHRAQTAVFTLRLNATSGEFVVEHGDMLYVAKTREALKAKMDEVGRITLSLAWTRYLEIEYKALTGHETGWSTNWLDVDERRTKKTRVNGVSLSWQIVEYTDEFSIPGQDPRRMRRAVADDGTPSDTLETADGLPDGLILWTPERLAVLRSIVDALTTVDVTMVKLFRGKAVFGLPFRANRQLASLLCEGRSRHKSC
jgi:hypothetical protein